MWNLEFEDMLTYISWNTFFVAHYNANYLDFFFLSSGHFSLIL